MVQGFDRCSILRMGGLTRVFYKRALGHEMRQQLDWFLEQLIYSFRHPDDFSIPKELQQLSRKGEHIGNVAQQFSVKLVGAVQLSRTGWHSCSG